METELCLGVWKFSDDDFLRIMEKCISRDVEVGTFISIVAKYSRCNELNYIERSNWNGKMDSIIKIWIAGEVWAKCMAVEHVNVNFDKLKIAKLVSDRRTDSFDTIHCESWEIIMFKLRKMNKNVLFT